MNQVQPSATQWDDLMWAVAAIFAVLLVFGWLVWNRWLSHREAMKLTEGGRDAREALRMRERRQLRHGLLWAVRMFAGGVALAVTMVIAYAWETDLGRRVIDSGDMLLLIGAAVFLLVVGLVTLVAYAIWSRRDVGVLAVGLLGEEKKGAPDADEEDAEESEAERGSEGERSE